MECSCDQCYSSRQLSIIECPECGKETCTSQVVGLTAELKCSNCGFAVIGASFYPACHQNIYYSIQVDNPDDAKKTVELSKILGVQIMDLYKAFKENEGTFSKEYKVLDCADKYNRITELGINCTLDPLLLKDFSRILDCVYKNG